MHGTNTFWFEVVWKFNIHALPNFRSWYNCSNCFGAPKRVIASLRSINSQLLLLSLNNIGELFTFPTCLRFCQTLPTVTWVICDTPIGKYSTFDACELSMSLFVTTKTFCCVFFRTGFLKPFDQMTIRSKSSFGNSSHTNDEFTLSIKQSSLNTDTYLQPSHQFI